MSNKDSAKKDFPKGRDTLLSLMEEAFFRDIEKTDEKYNVFVEIDEIRKQSLENQDASR